MPRFSLTNEISMPIEQTTHPITLVKLAQPTFSGQCCHLQVCDVAVDVHSGGFTVLRDVLVV